MSGKTQAQADGRDHVDGSTKLKVCAGNLSPIKTRRNPNVKYFEGQLLDSCKTVQFVSFEPKLHSKVNEAREDLHGVSLKNCS